MSYMVVSHVTDENKQQGIVESYQMISLPQSNDAGEITHYVPKRLNFVHWPEIPVPFVHEEWSDDLKFENIYTPENDDPESAVRLEEIEENADELIESFTPETWSALPEEVQAFIAFAASEEEEEDVDRTAESVDGEEEYEEDNT